MLPRTKRLNRELFGEINKGSKRIDTPLFLLKARFLGTDEPARFSCVVSKKVSKSAVSRNRLRRVFYEAIRKSSVGSLKGAFFVFYLKSPSLRAEQKDFETEIKLISRSFFDNKNVLRKGNDTV